MPWSCWPRWPARPPAGSTSGRWSPTSSSRLRQRLLDRAEHRLAVRVAALVVAHLAQLRRRQIGQAVGDLRRAEVVVAQDRERRRQAGGAAAAVDLAQYAVHARLAPRARRALARLLARVTGRVLDLLAAAAQQLLEVLHEFVCLS